jgi:hypothetical protein
MVCRRHLQRAPRPANHICVDYYHPRRVIHTVGITYTLQWAHPSLGSPGDISQHLVHTSHLSDAQHHSYPFRDTGTRHVQQHCASNLVLDVRDYPIGGFSFLS